MQDFAAHPREGKNVVFVSAVHDCRMLRRGSIQSLASTMAKLGHTVTFISVRFSLLSLIKGDSRNFLWPKANRPEWVDGVLCYLWFTAVHPFQSRNKILELLLRPHYWIHKRLKNSFLDDSFRRADVIVIESGQGILFAARARRLNPRAKIIYRASDKLSTIGASEMLQAELEKSAGAFDWFCLLSVDMADDFAWARNRTFYVPLGIDPNEYRDNGLNPYVASVNAVSVGSMLFDPRFFQTAARLFPAIEFHVIGCGTKFDAPSNVKFYDEMAFKDTLRYIEHASFGIAPYRDIVGAGYLATSSLKLKQYEYMGIPAVCPFFAVGQSRNRLGYAPANKASIEHAINQALNSAFVAIQPPLSWQEVARRLLDPQHYPDCDLSSADQHCASPQSKTRVALITGSSPPEACGVGDYTELLARHLNLIGIDATVINIGGASIFSTLNVKRRIENLNPSIVHIQYPTAGYRRSVVPYILASGILRVPTVATLHEFSIYRFYRKAAFVTFTWGLRARVYSNEFERRSFSRIFPLRSGTDIVIPIGSNIPVGKNAKSSADLIYFGLIMPDKGLEQFLELAESSLQLQRKYSFAIIGAIPEKFSAFAAATLERAGQLGVERLIGLPTDEVADLLSSAKLAYLPFPDGATAKRGSLIAALVNGLPVLTRHSNSTPEWLRTSTVAVADKEDALSKIDLLLSNHSERRRLSAISKACSERFMWPEIARQYCKLYASIDAAHV